VPHGAMMPLMPGRAPLSLVRQRKGEETACHALDEGTGVTRAQETGVQNNAMKNDLHPLDTYNTL